MREPFQLAGEPIDAVAWALVKRAEHLRLLPLHERVVVAVLRVLLRIMLGDVRHGHERRELGRGEEREELRCVLDCGVSARGGWAGEGGQMAGWIDGINGSGGCRFWGIGARRTVDEKVADAEGKVVVQPPLEAVWLARHQRDCDAQPRVRPRLARTEVPVVEGGESSASGWSEPSA